MKPTPEQLRELLRTVAATRPEEIDCEELLARVAAYLETVERGGEVRPELEAVAQHLEVCPECREDFDALVNAYRASPGDSQALPG